MNSRDKARDYFKKCNLSYSDISINDIYELISICNKFMFEDNILIMMNEPKFKGKNKNIILDSNNKIVYAALKVKGGYFGEREAITFNKDGFIAFCGWADMKRTKIFTDSFIEWCTKLVNRKDLINNG